MAEEEVIYSLNVIRYVGDMVLDGSTTYEGSTLQNNIYEFGNTADVATASSYVQNTVVLKVEGNLTINEGVTLTSVKSAWMGQKECLFIAHRTLTIMEL